MSSGAILVTGANGGLGAAIVSKILRSYPEHHGLYTVRNPSTASNLQKVINSAPSSHQHDILALDLSNLNQIRAFAKDINSRVSSSIIPPLRALILNAAFQEATTQTLTEDKRDMTFAVNYLANFLLVLLLLRSMDKEHGRIVFVSSWSHNPTDPRTFGRSGKEKDLFTDTESFVYPKTNPSEGSIRYGASKLCLLMMMFELQRRLNDDPQFSNISTLSVDPGAISTDITRHGTATDKFFMRYVVPTLAPLTLRFSPNGFFRTPAKSAADVLSAAFDVDKYGEYPKAVYLNGGTPDTPSEESRDAAKQKQLWTGTLKFVNIVEGDTALKNWA